MSKVVDFEQNLQHKVSEVMCAKCLKRWIAIRPSETLLKQLECEKCGSGFVIETGEET
jgi:hypothetical protein